MQGTLHPDTGQLVTAPDDLAINFVLPAKVPPQQVLNVQGIGGMLQILTVNLPVVQTDGAL